MIRSYQRNLGRGEAISCVLLVAMEERTELVSMVGSKYG